MIQPVIRALNHLTTRGLPALALLLGCGFGIPAPARAQDRDPAVLRPISADEHTLITAKAVDVLSRIALARLRTVKNPSRDDFRAAALALRIVRRLAPDDADLARMEIEAWTTAGNEDEALEQTRALLRIDPSDQVAQLRVAIAGLDQLQDVDARLKAYERILGPKGRAIDPTVRSRLSLDAALLARDNGDEKRFLGYLTTAMTLDPTNKGAAALFGSYVLGKSDNPMQRVEVLCNIILSDPLDAGTYENLALELLSHGAYAGALRAYMIGTQIAVAAGWTMTPDRVFDLALCEWRVRGPLPALGRINQVLQDSQIAENQRREKLKAEGLPTGPERNLFLPPDLDLMRLAIAVSQENEEGVKTVLDSYLTAGAMQLDQIRARKDETPEAKRRTRLTIEALQLQRLWAMLFARQRVDEAQALFDEILAENAPHADAAPGPADDSGAQLATPPADAGADPGADERASEDGATPPDSQDDTAPPALEPEVIQRFRGWLAMVNGQDRDAEELLSPLVETDVSARWAMAVLREQQGNTREAMLNFAMVAKDSPRSALSTAAWYRLVALRGQQVAPTAEADALNRYVMEFAPWLNTLASDPSTFMSLLAEHEERTIDPLGVIKVDITVRNVSPWPLAVGAGRPIPKRLMLAPRLRLRGKVATDLTEPAVALFQNRLRLEPSEAVTVVAAPTRGRLGTLLDFTPGAIASIRWQAVQGFTRGTGEGYKAGAMTITTLSDVVVRESLDDSIGTDELATRIASLQGAGLLRTIMVARRRIVDDLHDDADPAGARTLASAIIDRLPSMEPLEQAIVLGWFGESKLGVDDQFAPALRKALGDPSTYPAVALLVDFVVDPEDPLLQTLIASDDDDLSRLAFVTREVLRAEAAAPEATNAAGAPSTP